MTTLASEYVSWTAQRVCESVRKGELNLKENSDGKADCWQKFRLVENVDGKILFGWAVCVECSACIKYKSKTSDGSVKLYGTKNMTDHAKHCQSSTGKLCD